MNNGSLSRARSVDWLPGSNLRKQEKARRYNEIARVCEEYINRKMQEGSDTKLFLYAELAYELGFNTDEVMEVMSGVDGGNNGIMVRKEPITAFR